MTGKLHMFKLTQLLHSYGTNVRHAGRVLQLLRARTSERERRLHSVEYRDLRLLMMVEMLARCVKNELRLLMRERMREIRVPLEQPYSQLVIDQLNRVFGRSSRSTLYWSNVLKRRLLESFACDAGLSGAELDQTFDLKAGFVSLGVRGEAHPLSMMFMRVSECAGLRFEPRIYDEILRSPTRFETARPFDEIDLIDIGESVKHMNIVVLAQAHLFKMQGKVLRARDPLAAQAYFNRSINRFEEYLASMPNNKLALVNCAETLFYLQKELELEARTLEREKATAAAADKLHAAQSLQGRANAMFLKLVKLDPQDASSLYHYAKFLDKSESLDDAEEYYLHSMECDPNMVQCLREYGHFLVEKRRKQDAAAPFYARAKRVQELIASGQRLCDVSKFGRYGSMTPPTTPQATSRRDARHTASIANGSSSNSSSPTLRRTRAEIIRLSSVMQRFAKQH